YNIAFRMMLKGVHYFPAPPTPLTPTYSIAVGGVCDPPLILLSANTASFALTHQGRPSPPPLTGITIKNNGAPQSTLNWTATVTNIVGGWTCSVFPDHDSLKTNVQPEPITITASATSSLVGKNLTGYVAT